MSSTSSVYVYAFETRVNEATEASLREVILAVLQVRRFDDRNLWTVAATIDQGLRLLGLSWVINPRQLGPMSVSLNGEYLEFSDPISGETLAVSIESLAR